MLCTVLAANVFASEKTICGKTDDRQLSFEAPVGRLSVMERNYGCTVTMISRSCGISAGHCITVLEKAEFNTPGSIDRQAKPADPSDTYLIDRSSIVYENGGRGNDWSVMKLKPNSITGKFPGDVQGFYEVKFKKPAVGSKLRITGYGVDNDDDDRNFAQQTHTGNLVQYGSKDDVALMTYSVDTMGGNSGSTIRLESTNEIVGIHTHGGCYQYGGANSGTLIASSPKLIQAIKSCLESDN